MSDANNRQGQKPEEALSDIFEPDVPVEYRDLQYVEIDDDMAQALRDRAISRAGYGFTGKTLPRLSKEFVVAHCKLLPRPEPAKVEPPQTMVDQKPQQTPQQTPQLAPTSPELGEQDAQESQAIDVSSFTNQLASFGGAAAFGAQGFKTSKDTEVDPNQDIELMDAELLSAYEGGPYDQPDLNEPTEEDYAAVNREPVEWPEHHEQELRGSSRLSEASLKQNVSAMMSFAQEEQRKADIVEHEPSTRPVREEIKVDPVYGAAVKLQQLPPINLAYVWYLQDHYGFAKDKEQSAFNIVLLGLFSKMQDGHICVNLESVINLYDALKPWTSKAHQEKVKLEELAQEREEYGFAESITSTALTEFNDIIRLYAPRNDAELSKLIIKSGAVVNQPTANGVSLDQLPELPLVWDLNRLYIRRNFIYEQQICNYIQHVSFEQYSAEQKAKIKSFIDVLFPQEKYERESKDKGGINWQKVAALMSLVSNFTVISGGPGTGKTTTVFNLLLLLLCLNDKNLNIMMCAPTAKAAARMGESIASQLSHADTKKRIAALCALQDDPEKEQQINAIFDIQATTVHSLLKVRPHLVTPVYNANNKLTCDVLIVDEVSMLDLALFAKLLAAMPQGCKLILLGDKDQLSSVGAGMVLGDICSILSSKDRSRIKPEVLDFISETASYSKEMLLQGKIANHITLLQFSWRSNKVANIGKLAKIFNDAQTVDAHDYRDSIKQESQKGKISKRNFDAILDGQYAPFLFDDHSERLHECQRLMEDIKALCEVYDYSGEVPLESVQPQEPKQTPLVLRILPPALEPEEELGGHKGQYPHTVKGASKRGARAYKDKMLAYNHNISQLRFAQVRSWVDAKGDNNYGAFLKRLKDLKFRVKRDSAECEELFKLMDQFRVLCSNHDGWFGDKKLNELMSIEVLRTYVNNSGLFEHKFEKGEFFPGQIVLITENDPMLNLVNGSVGFCAYEEEEHHESQDIVSKVQDVAAKLDLGQIKVRHYGRSKDAAHGSFRGGLEEQRRVLRLFVRDGTGKGAIKVISTLLLSHYETGYAMSIHKSQGSEYDSVAIALNQRANPILTKELVYTGITRAKKHVELVASQESMEYALKHAVVRESGLAERLFGSLHGSKA